MTTQAEFDAYVATQRNVRALIRRDLNAWWLEVASGSPSEIREAAREFLPLLANTYGEVSATVAADFFDEARAASPGARGRFAATLPRLQAARAAARQVRWATEPLFRSDFEGALGRMSLVADEAAMQEGRNTIMHNAERDRANPRFARIPVGKTCAWCLTLASRGAVYRSAESAGAAGQYHGGKCDCQPMPSWTRDGKDMPEGYQPDALYEDYLRARKATGQKQPDMRAIAKAYRRLDGGSLVEDGVSAAT